MSRNLSRTHCAQCGGEVICTEQPRRIRRSEAGRYYAEFSYQLVACAACDWCNAKYLAWFRSGQPPHDDLSYRSSFNDEPGPEDLPGDGVVSYAHLDRKTPEHDVLAIWNRGEFAGELTVTKGDAKKIVARLLPHLLTNQRGANTHPPAGACHDESLAASPETPDELRNLERELALECAEMLIASGCYGVGPASGEHDDWWELPTTIPGILGKGLRYLELRGILQRHHENPELIRIAYSDSSPTTSSPMCADCAGFDIEWMYSCEKHGTQFCRGCECPECVDDRYLDPDDFDDGEMYDQA